MKLRTSYFNTSVLKKDITRFAPLWGLYTVFMLLFLLLTWSDYDSPGRFARNADAIMMLMGAVNCGYAGLAALFLFGDLFKARLCNALHALPMRREGWFLTHLAAGILFCLIPNALGAVLSAAMLGQYAFLSYAWLGLMILEYLCFFGIGVFSVMCAGSLLGSAAVYGIINFLSVLLLWMVKSFYEPVLFGVTIDAASLARLSPVIALCTQNYSKMSYSYEAEILTFNGFVGESWLYALLAALAGLALMAAALFMYRSRKLEAAGDFIAFRPAGPAFLVLYSLCGAAVLYLMGDAVDSNLGYVFLMIGLAIGWFTGLMLLNKRVNVFRLKTFVGLGVLIFAFYLSVTVVWLDPIGITRYVPEADQVQTVQIAPYASDYYYRENATYISDPAQVEKLTQLHEKLVRERSEDRSKMMLRIQYTMKTGVMVERTYYVKAMSEDGQWLKGLYSGLPTVLGGDNLQRLKQTTRYMEVYGYMDKADPQWEGQSHFELKNEDFDGLIDAIALDCKEGNMAQIWDYHADEEQIAVVSVEFGAGSFREVQVYECAKYTVNYLQQMAQKYLQDQSKTETQYADVQIVGR